MRDYKILVGDNIKEALFHARRTQEQLAQALGVHKNTVNNWVTGESEPSYGTLGKIAYFTGQNILTLIDPDQMPFNRKPEVNFRQRRRGAQPQKPLDNLLVGCVGGGDDRIRTGE